MGTLVAFHAHPDDEAISTGGSLAKAAAGGHRVVLVVATGGEAGEVAPGYLDDGETLAERRAAETEEAARVLGIHRVVFLGYRDSGMMGTPGNGDAGTFWSADVNEAAQRLARLLRAEGADVLTCYDANGGYGHPDHIQVHRVGHRAADLAGTPRVFEATMNRDRIIEMMEEAGGLEPGGPGSAGDDSETDYREFGTPDAEITTAVDVTGWLDVKRRAMAAHGSQITENSFFLQMPPDRFAAAFGTEWFIQTRPEPGPERGSDLFG